MDIHLDSRRERLLKATRDVLADVRDMLSGSGTAESDKSALADSIRQLDRLFLLVIAGEFNSGKSAFINALIAQKIQEEGVTPTTSKIHILQYGDTLSSEPGPHGTWLQTAPIPILKNTSIVDTPGTNAILREHELLTTQFIPRSDLVIFVTSADRPFTESERAFLELIKSWGKKIVLVVNKIDILTPGEVDKVIDFVRSAARQMLGDAGAVFAVSARRAQGALPGQADPDNPHGFEALNAYIQKTLDDIGRFRLKLLNPLGVGRKLIRSRIDLCQADLDSLSGDLAVLDRIQRQMEVFSRDMQRNFTARLGEIDSLLYEMENRGKAYFNETLRIGRVFDLVSRSKIRMAFERQVVADTPQKLESRVSELIDWLIEQDLRQWTSIAEYLKKHQQQYADRIVGQGSPREGTLTYDRQRLIDSIGLATREAVSTYNKEKESARIAETAKEAVIQTGLVGLGGLGLGASVAVFLHTAWADLTGILTGAVALAFGVFILPSRRSRVKKQLSKKLESLRHTLAGGLNEQFDREMRRTLRRMEDIVSPYSRFVRSEQDSLTVRLDRLGELQSRMTGLENQLEQLK